MNDPIRCARSARHITSTIALSAALAISAFTSAPVNADPSGSTGSAMPAQPMSHLKMEGMKGMDGMSMTGDADYDFAVNMRKHHQMALTMSEAELKNGKNPEMRKMATEIIAAQKKEIATFDEWIAAHKEPATK